VSKLRQYFNWYSFIIRSYRSELRSIGQWVRHNRLSYSETCPSGKPCGNREINCDHNTSRLATSQLNEQRYSPWSRYFQLEVKKKNSGWVWDLAEAPVLSRVSIPESNSTKVSLRIKGIKLCTFTVNESRTSSVGIATGYGLDYRRGRNSSPGRVRNFHFSISQRPSLGYTKPPLRWVQVLFLRE
jgi:hypothetical protein